MATSVLLPQSAQVVRAEVRASAPLSASTTARYRQAKEGFEVAKEQAIRDLAKNPSLEPQEAMNAIANIQNMHKKIDHFTTDIANMANSELTADDAPTMRQMRKEGATDAKIAEWFDTNPTRVNRMINGSQY
jgi:hypothetical protein